eukprot:3536903-Rhodomonas_salina.1
MEKEQWAKREGPFRAVSTPSSSHWSNSPGSRGGTNVTRTHAASPAPGWLSRNACWAFCSGKAVKASTSAGTVPGGRMNGMSFMSTSTSFLPTPPAGVRSLLCVREIFQRKCPLSGIATACDTATGNGRPLCSKMSLNLETPGRKVASSSPERLLNCPRAMWFDVGCFVEADNHLLIHEESTSESCSFVKSSLKTLSHLMPAFSFSSAIFCPPSKILHDKNPRHSKPASITKPSSTKMHLTWPQPDHASRLLSVVLLVGALVSRPGRHEDQVLRACASLVASLASSPASSSASSSASSALFARQQGCLEARADQHTPPTTQAEERACGCPRACQRFVGMSEKRELLRKI